MATPSIKSPIDLKAPTMKGPGPASVKNLIEELKNPNSESSKKEQTKKLLQMWNVQAMILYAMEQAEIQHAAIQSKLDALRLVFDRTETQSGAAHQAEDAGQEIKLSQEPGSGGLSHKIAEAEEKLNGLEKQLDTLSKALQDVTVKRTQLNQQIGGMQTAQIAELMQVVPQNNANIPRLNSVQMQNFQQLAMQQLQQPAPAAKNAAPSQQPAPTFTGWGQAQTEIKVLGAYNQAQNNVPATQSGVVAESNLKPSQVKAMAQQGVTKQLYSTLQNQAPAFNVIGDMKKQDQQLAQKQKQLQQDIAGVKKEIGTTRSYLDSLKNGPAMGGRKSAAEEKQEQSRMSPLKTTPMPGGAGGK